MYDKKIFISGNLTSGSTLLHWLLSHDDETTSISKDASYMKFLFESFQKGLLTWSLHTHNYFMDQKEYLKFNKFILDTYFIQCKNMLGNDILVQSCPGLMSLIPAINMLYSDSLFIIMYRDIRDYFALYSEYDSNKPNDYFLNMFINEFKPLNEFINYYKSNNKPVKNILFVSYEDLILNTDKQMDIIRNFTRLKLDFTPDPTWWKNNPLDSNYITNSTEVNFNSDNIGIYKTLLSKNDLNYIDDNYQKLSDNLPLSLFYKGD